MNTRFASSFALSLFVLFQQAQPALSQAVEEAHIKAILNTDGSYTLKGAASYYDLAFGGSDITAYDNCSVGIKAVGFGQHLFIKGETKKDLLKESKEDGGTLMITPAGITREDRSSKGGWWSWYSKVSRDLSNSWVADVPGQMQVLLEINPKGEMRILNEQAFLPGFDRNNQLVSGVREKFRASVDAAIRSANNAHAAAFPAGSTSKSVVMMARFISDHDLEVSVPDLRLFDGLPQDEKSLRIARICSIFDSVYLYAISDKLRAALPATLHHRFVPEGFYHGFYSQTPENFYCISTSKQEKSNPLWMEISQYASMILSGELATGKLIDAERFAKSLAATPAISSRSEECIELVANKLNEFGLTNEVAKFKSAVAKIKSEETRNK